MPTEEAKQLEELGLAPPPSFGVADRTDKHMLPVATAMEDILNEDIDELAALGTDSGAVPSEALESLESLEALEPAPAASVPKPEAPPSVESVPSVDHGPQPESNSGGRRLAVVGLLLSAAALAMWVWIDRGQDGSPAEGTTPAQGDTIAKAGQPAGLADNPAVEAKPNDDESGSELDSQVASANNIAEMKAASYTSRHALLETLERQGATGRVDLDLHIALDLMQADQSASPCATFADALTLIEADPDRPSVRPALASVQSVPTPGRREASDACDGLQQRLDALTAPAAEQAPTTSSASKPSKSKRKRPSKRGTAKSPKPPAPAAAAPPPAAEPKSEPTPDKPKPNVISKLDDDLRE